MTTDFVRPGPPSIDPATAPGGVVLHVYSVPDGRLILVQYVTIDSDIERQARHGADRAAAAIADGDAPAVCLVGYDGDTGLRLSLVDALGASR